MPAYVIDLRADRRWIELVERIKEALLSRLGDVLVRIVALASPDDELYGSNVLIVVERDDDAVVRSVMESVAEVERSAGVEGVMSPLIVTPNERRIIEGFEAYETPQMDEDAWPSLVKELCINLRKRVPGSKVVALKSPRDRVYDSNILIICKQDDDRTVEEILRSVVDAERSTGVEGVISPLIVTPNERRIIEGFGGYEVVC